MLELQIASDLDHDHVVAEINDDGSFLCLLSKEDNDDDVMIELPLQLPIKGPDSMRRIPLSDFLQMINRAKEKLVNPK